MRARETTQAAAAANSTMARTAAAAAVAASAVAVKGEGTGGGGGGGRQHVQQSLSRTVGPASRPASFCDLSWVELMWTQVSYSTVERAHTQKPTPTKGAGNQASYAYNETPRNQRKHAEGEATKGNKTSVQRDVAAPHKRLDQVFPVCEVCYCYLYTARSLSQLSSHTNTLTVHTDTQKPHA